MLDLEDKLARFGSEPDWLELPLPVDPGRAEHESVLVRRLSAGTFRVLSTPGFVEGIAAGDVLETPWPAPEGYRLLARGNNLAIRFVVRGESQVAVARAHLEAAFRPLGGQLDATMGRRGLTYTVPVAAGFPSVEAVLAEAVSRFPDSAWWYGNVHDAEGHLLDWWQVRESEF